MKKNQKTLIKKIKLIKKFLNSRVNFTLKRLKSLKKINNKPFQKKLKKVNIKIDKYNNDFTYCLQNRKLRIKLIGNKIYIILYRFKHKKY